MAKITNAVLYESPKSPRTAMQRATINIIDDDPSMNEAIQRLLTADGWPVSGFPSAEAFLKSWIGESMACLILDIHLPGMSGFDLHEHLAESEGCPSVIYITAHDGSMDRERAKRGGALGYFVKPFPGRGLLDTLHRHYSEA